MPICNFIFREQQSRARVEQHNDIYVSDQSSDFRISISFRRSMSLKPMTVINSMRFLFAIQYYEYYLSLAIGPHHANWHRCRCRWIYRILNIVGHRRWQGLSDNAYAFVGWHHTFFPSSTTAVDNENNVKKPDESDVAIFIGDKISFVGSTVGQVKIATKQS